MRRGSLDGSASYRGSTSESQAEHVIDPADIELCLRDDGTCWKLGEGGFGTVGIHLPLGSKRLSENSRSAMSWTLVQASRPYYNKHFNASMILVGNSS